jgi:hypothetical protein
VLAFKYTNDFQSNITMNRVHYAASVLKKVTPSLDAAEFRGDRRGGHCAFPLSIVDGDVMAGR